MSAENIKKNDLISFAREALAVPYREGGRDWSGWDCWGLVVCLFRQVYGLELPAYEDSQELSVSLECARQATEVPAGREHSGDIILFRGEPLHAGVVIRPGEMLHCLEDFGTKVDAYRQAIWRSRLLGIYRHAGLSAR